MVLSEASLGTTAKSAIGCLINNALHDNANPQKDKKMRPNQRDLVDVVFELSPLGVIKG